MSSRKKKSGQKKGPPGDVSSTPWDGTLDKTELGRGGGNLMAMLYGRAHQLGHTRLQLAEFLGVSYAFLAQVASGFRNLGNLNETFRERAALYLGVPRMTILRAIGVVREQDFYDHPENLPWQIQAGMEHIGKDPNEQPYFPEEFLGGMLTSKQKFWIVRLYEKATGAKLLTERTDLEKINKMFRAIDEQRREVMGE